MRKLLPFILLSIFLPIQAKQAYNRQGIYNRLHAEPTNYFGFYAQGGFAALQPLGINQLEMGKGYNAGAGITYELKRDNLLFDVGCGFVWQRMSLQRIGLDPWHEPRVDTQNTPYTLDTYTRRWDQVEQGSMDIPIMLGGQWNRFFLLGGVKVGIDVMKTTSMHARITTAGTYDRYFIPITETDNHGFRTDVPIVQPTTNYLGNIDVRLSLELGYQMRTIVTAHANIRSRIGAFVDYGVYTSPVMHNSLRDITKTSDFDFASYRMNPLLSSDGTNLVGHLMAGVKYTILFGKPEKCIDCVLFDQPYVHVRHQKKCVICGQYNMKWW